MIRTAFAGAIILQFLLVTVAFSGESGPYLGLYGGANLMGHDIQNDSSLGSFNLGFQDGTQAGLTLGHRLAPGSDYGNGRIELEIGYRQNKVDQMAFADGKFNGAGEETVWNLMLSSYGEYANGTRWTPYVGVGVGVAMISLSGVEVGGTPVADDEDTVLAYQLGCGVSFAIFTALELDLGYRFFGTSRPEFKDVDGVAFKSEYYAHDFQLGVRYSF